MLGAVTGRAPELRGDQFSLSTALDIPLS